MQIKLARRDGSGLPDGGGLFQQLDRRIALGASLIHGLFGDGHAGFLHELGVVLR